MKDSLWTQLSKYFDCVMDLRKDWVWIYTSCNISNLISSRQLVSQVSKQRKSVENRRVKWKSIKTRSRVLCDLSSRLEVKRMRKLRKKRGNMSPNQDPRVWFFPKRPWLSCLSYLQRNLFRPIEALISSLMNLKEVWLFSQVLNYLMKFVTVSIFLIGVLILQ